MANLAIFSVARGYYGTNTLFVIRVMPNDRNLAAQKVSAIGSEWAREEFNWQTLNPSRGRYLWANSDQAMNTYRRNNIKVLGLITYSSLWGSSQPRTGTNAQFYKPNITYWKQYVEALVRRYGGTVKDWEIWNEPNYFWKPAPSADEYREVLIAAYDTIKAIDPGARVGSGGTTYIDNGYINSFLDNGGFEHLDAVSVHYYSDVGPESAPGNRLRDELVKLVEDSINRRGGGKEIWITEMGWQSGRIGEQAQAEVISRAIVLARSVNEVRKIMIYSLRDERSNSYGLLKRNFQPKTAYNYYKKTVEYLGTKTISEIIDLQNDDKFFIFNDGGGAMAVAWNPERIDILGFHVNASGIRCYDLKGFDVTNGIVLHWDNGDVVIGFSPTPVFCQLDNYSVGQNNQGLKTRVAGVATAASDQVSGGSPAQVSGQVLNFPGSKQIADGRVIAYQKKDSGWKKYQEKSMADWGYNLELPDGQYYLAYKAPGYLSTKSQTFAVKGTSDVSFRTTLFNAWLAYGVLAGGIIVLILLIIKYSIRKT